MSRARSVFKGVVPAPLWRRGSDVYWWWHNRGNHQLAAAFSARRRASVHRLAEFRDLHRGHRCFILGNGPSLNRTDLRPLREEFTFGMNRVYLLFPRLGFTTTYYVCVNTLVIEQCAADIAALSLPRFVTWRGRRWLSGDPGCIFLDTDYRGQPTFSEDATGRVFEGSTVTYVALQLAFFMGFDEVILIGVDHHFATQGAANATVVSQGDDPDHFDSGYFGRGFRWQLPDLEASEAAYRMARRAFESAGRKVLDATPGGKLTVFPKVEYQGLFPRRIA
jgi:hypothetical protein